MPQLKGTATERVGACHGDNVMASGGWSFCTARPLFAPAAYQLLLHAFNHAALQHSIALMHVCTDLMGYQSDEMLKCGRPEGKKLPSTA